MRFALFAPPFGDFSDPRFVAELAYEAEDTGWDGFFLWDVMLWDRPQPQPIADTWVTLTAMALRTHTLTLGTIVTPLPQYAPWKLARQTVSIDRLSEGRLILGVGAGGDWMREYSAFGRIPDSKLQAAMLDEGLEVLTRLWSGEIVTYHGQHYQVDQVQFLPTPYQQPRIPLWAAGTWPIQATVRRAARWDGMAPFMRDGTPTPASYHALRAAIMQERTLTTPFDLIHGVDLEHRVETDGQDAVADADLIAPFAAAGVTWWLEDISYLRGSLAMVRERIRRGPPRH